MFWIMRPFAHTLCDLEAAGKIPTRVTHNDTMLNNISSTRHRRCIRAMT